MSVITNNLLQGDEGYTISRSVRLRSSASAYFNRTPAGTGNQQKWTWSGWVKRGSFGQQQLFTAGAGTGGSPECYIDFEDNLNFQIFDGTSNLAVVRSTAVYRDPSAWYHVVVAIDTTQATAANRVLLYVNGQAITSFAFSTYPTQNLNTQVNATTAHRISSSTRTSAYYFDGYLTEINFIDGQALTPSSFGETDAVTGVWKAKKYTGTYGTNGFYLNFSDNSSNTSTTIGKDWSGNGNNWTPNNISVTAGVTYDSMLDVPTMWADGGNGRGNYATLNPLSNDQYSTLTDGNLNLLTSVTLSGGLNSSIGVSSGKWYWETTVGATGSPNQAMLGIRNQSAVITGSGGYPGGDTNGYGYYASNGNKYNSTASAYGASYTSGDVIGVAFDADAGTLTFYKNNTSQGVAFSSIQMTNNIWFPAFGDGSSGSQCLLTVNFGQRPFAYTPPTGFKALNTQNLPDATIKKGNAYFDVSTWTGDGTSSRAITNSGSFQPDLVWTKARSGASNLSHLLVDAVRGATATLSSDQTAAEYTLSTGVTAFNSNGFQIGTFPNGSGQTEVGWQWKESVSAGFDIVTYTGNGTSQNINHSLGVVPSMIIVKNRSVGSGWRVWHKNLTSASYVVYLNATNAQTLEAAAFNGTTPTSTQFSVGASGDTNGSGNSEVAYLFADVAGYSKFGSYTGNGSTDGPFVYTGFKPRYILVKRSDSTGDWNLHDTARDSYNVADKSLFPNVSNAEATPYYMDIVSNGFKIRDSGSSMNTSSGTYIFAAFAENPFKNSLAR